ncbi:hypothetical protein KKF29_00685 [Patescibacteria group bacterium]|nr:hypothetical protein [Patescibacteria group bacterium]
MRLYYFSKTESDIPSIIQNAGVDLWQKPQDANLSIIDETGLSFLEQVDGLVLEITEADPQINYFLAQAILQRKPTLCLYQKNKVPRQLLVYLNQKNIPKEIVTKAYTEKNLEKIIINFLKPLGIHEEEREVPSIKFTLRLTDKIEKYLNFKAKEEKINKADYIRNLIQKEIREDKKFRNYLNKKD